MKLEIDLNDREALLAKREELNRAIMVLEAALSNFPKGTSAAPPAGGQMDFVRIKRTAESFLSALPQRFKISHLLAMPNSGLNRPAARRFIDEWISDAKVKIVEKVRGSAGNTYEKVT